MFEKLVQSKTFAVIAFLWLIGYPILLIFLGGFQIISPRGWANGMIIWFVGCLIWAIVRPRSLARSGAALKSNEPLDPVIRERLLRRIRMRKIWIGILVASLPIAVAAGVAQRAWVPTIIATMVNLFLIYAAVREIQIYRKNLSKLISP